jgi:hypothetical protein
VAEDCQSLFDIIRAHLTVLHGKVPVIEEVQALDDPEKWVPMTDLRVAEREPEPTLPVTVGTGAEAKLPVAATLNTAESEAARKAASPEAEPRMQLFISYAPERERADPLPPASHALEPAGLHPGVEPPRSGRRRISATKRKTASRRLANGTAFSITSRAQLE